MESTQLRGPYVGVAALCEKALQEKDEVLTLVRIVDQFTVTPMIANLPPGAPLPDPLPQPVMQTTLALVLKSGDARGTHEISIELENPLGDRVQIGMPISVLFEGDDRGVNIVASVTIAVEHPGLSWIDVRCDDRVLTRVPLRIDVLPLEPQEPSSAP